jgi:hypothetical protein
VTWNGQLNTVEQLWDSPDLVTWDGQLNTVECGYRYSDSRIAICRGDGLGHSSYGSCVGKFAETCPGSLWYVSCADVQKVKGPTTTPAPTAPAEATATTEATAEATTEAPADDATTEATAEATTEAPADDAATEATAEATTEAPADDATAEATAEATTEAPTDDATAEATTEAPAELGTEAATAAPTTTAPITAAPEATFPLAVVKEASGGDWVTVTCDDGQQVLGGGCNAVGSPHIMQRNGPFGVNGWKCGGHGGDKTAWVICGSLQAS